MDTGGGAPLPKKRKRPYVDWKLMAKTQETPPDWVNPMTWRRRAKCRSDAGFVPPKGLRKGKSYAVLTVVNWRYAIVVNDQGVVARYPQDCFVPCRALKSKKPGGRGKPIEKVRIPTYSRAKGRNVRLRG